MKIQAGRKYPLVLALHGLSGNATAATELGSPALREQFPCFVMAPVSTADGLWASPYAELKQDKIRQSNPADRPRSDGRFYQHAPHRSGPNLRNRAIHGGAGTYNARHYRPGVFAAAIPVCGLSDPKDNDVLLKRAIWVHKGKVAWRIAGESPLERAELPKLRGALFGHKLRLAQDLGMAVSAKTNEIGSKEIRKMCDDSNCAETCPRGCCRLFGDNDRLAIVGDGVLRR